MKCADGRSCDMPERCELLGCLAPKPLGVTLARRPDLPVGAAIALGLTGPSTPPRAAAPSPAPDPYAAPEAAPVSDQPNSRSPIAPAPERAWSAPPTTIKPTSRPRDVRCVSVPTGGFVIIEDNAPVAVALDPVGAGGALAKVLGG